MLSLNMVRFTLSKAERLSSVKAIERLFKEGRSLTRYPVRLVWLQMDRSEDFDVPVQVMFSASKKRYARAVDRNRIKRLLREAYRLYKPTFYTLLPPDQTIHLAVVYTGKEIEPMEDIQKKIIQALGNMIKELSPA
jgi:ribonuclease P protein component